MPDRRDHISVAVRDAMAVFKTRTGDMYGKDAILHDEIEIAVRAAATDSYQRGASWGLQQHQPITVNINCPHTEHPNPEAA